VARRLGRQAWGKGLAADTGEGPASGAKRGLAFGVGHGV